jgi:DNA-binding transcriptional ArsR family regulator
MQLVEQLLDLAGIGRNRMALRWVSAAEGQIFANTVGELTEATKALGPFDLERHKLQMTAVEAVVRGPRMRWLTGMDRHVTEKANVYGEKIDEELYRKTAKQALTDEYHKALIMESLKAGPLSVREMASATGLPVYTVSLRLNDLEKRGLAELKGYEGSTPKFIALAA